MVKVFDVKEKKMIDFDEEQFIKKSEYQNKGFLDAPRCTGQQCSEHRQAIAQACHQTGTDKIWLHIDGIYCYCVCRTIVPNAKGLTEAQARDKIEAEALVAHFTGIGERVGSQVPGAGTTVSPGTTVAMHLPEDIHH